MDRVVSIAGAALLESAVGFRKSKLPHVEFRVLYERILRLLPQLPEDYIYRKSLEKSLHEKNEMVLKYSDVAELEQKMGQGSIEDVMHQMTQELTLVQHMIEAKPWERLIEKPPPHQWTWPPYI